MQFLSLNIFLIPGGFNLPVNEERDPTLPGSYHALMDALRDTATLSILERLQKIPKGRFTSRLIEKMHLLGQDLMYFRNVDGSFGDSLTQQTFGYFEFALQ